MGFVRNQSVPFAMAFGIVGALACIARNPWSSKG
jgi:hypothetical protein